MKDRIFVAWQDENKCEPSFSVVDYNDFIDKKIDDVRKGTDSASSPFYTVNGTSNLNQFKTIDVNLVTKIIRESPTKHCNLDPIPTWLVKDCVSLLTPYITRVANHSVVEGCFLKVFSDLIDAMDSDRLMLQSLLDLSAMFDTVDHDILRLRMSKSFRVTGKSMQWFNSYLTD